MKTKNIIILLSFIAIIFSCKKGEKDPFLSLTSRKARMANEWKIESWKKTAISSGLNQFNQPIDSEISYDLNQSTYVVNSPALFYIPFFTGTAKTTEASWVIDKKGEWTRTLNYEYSTQNYANTTTEVAKGNWNFLSKGNDYKNKERVIFNITSEYKKEIFNNNNGTNVVNESTEEYNNGDKALIYEIVQLKSKEVILKRSSLRDETSPIDHVVTNTEEEYILKKD